ncbi:hypothetical protein GRS48_01385 [Halorubrum sp. JWXQ-INN 858]|uniref:OapC/ArvC family zinc-ribbon domain-containing protein n=1 Tax=Halorubrum sp. JWXQ-INN 858 TaxID=2690782 RepID=UPI0013595434|nr:Zn-ribbon containing protein [Halorubrum sp. JWXQ-INN 858]MWV63482.1 hypothetical protein [Halorubrum sp. JWXQ-INN 858]
MPHQCTECGRTFPDGSKEMLSGCPDCGGNKFQFKPNGVDDENAVAADPTGSTEPPTPTDSTEPRGSTDPKPTRSEPKPTPSEPKPTQSEPKPTAERSASSERVSDIDNEDTAQASARSDVVSPDELDRASQEVPPAADESAEPGSGSDPDSGQRPGIDDLRDELNAQFESIRIVSPGKYELNLMELYDRQEYIISLQEDGRYVIEMPDAWGVNDE